MGHVRADRLAMLIDQHFTDRQEAENACGLKPGLLEDVIAGNRRVGWPVLKTLNACLPPLVDFAGFLCNQHCPACRAPNNATEENVAIAKSVLVHLLTHLLDCLKPDAAAMDIKTQVRVVEDDGDPILLEQLLTQIRWLGGWLTTEELAEHGVLGKVAQDKTTDIEAMAEELTPYVLWADVDRYHLVGTDLFPPTTYEAHLPEGWEARYLGWDELYDFLPVAAAAPYRKSPPFDVPATWATWWLVLKESQVTPSRTVAPRNLTSIKLTFLLAHDAIPSFTSYVVAQAGRGLTRIWGRDVFIDTSAWPVEEREYLTIEEDGEISERPVDEDETWLAKIECATELIDRNSPSDDGVKRFWHAAAHFVRAAEELRDGPSPRTALEYSIAFEVLINDGQDRGEITTRLSAAVAWLVGESDNERQEAASLMKDLYHAGSAYRHGGKQPCLHRGGRVLVDGKWNRSVDLACVHTLCRRAFFVGLAVIDSGQILTKACERAFTTTIGREDLAELRRGLVEEVGSITSNTREAVYIEDL